jgi:protein-tyrosine phosphatase
MKEKLEKNILVVCSGNINRSPAGEYLFRKYGYKNVDSCGLGKTSTKGLPMTKRMKEVIGEDVQHKSKQITQELVDWADIIYCMGPGQVKKVNTLFNTTKAEILSGKKIEDPHFTGEYKKAFDDIELFIRKSTNYYL